jgi:hypothetical protein
MDSRLRKGMCGGTAECSRRWMYGKMMVSFWAAVVLAAVPVYATGGDFSVDFVAAAPGTYDPSSGTGLGAHYGDGIVRTDIVNSLQGGDFEGDDVVAWLALITVRESASDDQRIRLDFSFAATNTGHPGAAISDVIYVGLTSSSDTANNHDNDGGTVDYSRSLSGTELLCSVTIDDLDHGETLVIRIDTLLSRAPDSYPTGNLYGQLDSGTVLDDSLPLRDATISTGRQTVPFQKVAEIVNRPPVAVDDSATTDEDTAVIIDVLYNDSDPDGDSLTVTDATDPSYGTIVINSNGTVTYTPTAGYNGPDSFTYTITDSHAGTATATVDITVAPINDPPVAVDDMATTNEDTSVTITVLSNDSDPDGDPLTVTLVSDPPNGSAVINIDGTVTYTPETNFNGSDSFTYTISDGTDTATAEVRVTVGAVNDGPVAVDDSAETPEDTPVTVDVLDNDSDPDGDPLTVTAVSDPPHGAAAINPDGTVTYTPDLNFNGSDSFTYTISDGGATATATVTVTVGPVNDGPVAVDDSAATNEDTPVTVNVLGNDSDPDGDPLTITVVSTPGHGTAAIDSGQVVYTPDADYNGPDSFTYTISDGNGGTATATVYITINPINDPPVAVNDAGTTDQDVPITIPVLGNDTDVDGDTLTVISITSPPQPHGTVVINPDQTVTYTPFSLFAGIDTFIYTISDGNGGTASATVTITVVPTNIRSIQVRMDSRTLTGTYLEGAFTIKNTSSGGLPVQVTAFSLKVDYKPVGDKKWNPNGVTEEQLLNLWFSESPYFEIDGNGTVYVSFSCDLPGGVIPAGAATKVTVGVQIASVPHGAHEDSWYYSSM